MTADNIVQKPQKCISPQSSIPVEVSNSCSPGYFLGGLCSFLEKKASLHFIRILWGKNSVKYVFFADETFLTTYKKCMTQVFRN
jgi:hypothetical protein